MNRKIVFLAWIVAGIFPAELYAQFGKISSAPPQLIAELSEAIVNKGYRKVGVLPQFIVRADGQQSLQGALGPHSRLLADGVMEGLAASAQGNFEVADDRTMRDAFKGIAVDDLENPAKLREIAQAAGGLDALVVGSVADIPSESPGVMTNIQCELLDLANQTKTKIPDHQLKMSLAGLAYRGESFELRRWVRDVLTKRDLTVSRFNDMFKPVDFNPFLSKIPPGFEPWFTHPNLDSSCPFHVDVVVDGKPRPQTLIGRQLYVPVSYGERYEIDVRNRGAKEAFVAVFIDGLNILGKKPQHPGNCRYWHLDPDSVGHFGGWYTGESGSYKQEEFRISRATDSEATKQGFTTSLGQITAVLYTVGPAPTPPPPKFDPRRETAGAMSVGAMAPGSENSDDIGTEAGAQHEVQIEEVRSDQPGVILAAISLYYRTPARIEELQQKAGSH